MAATPGSDLFLTSYALHPPVQFENMYNDHKRLNISDSLNSSTIFTSDHSRPRTGQTTTRPRTAQSGPNTGRPTTAASTRHEATYVVALLEGRGVSREVGMAAIDRDTGLCVLVQVAFFAYARN
jgi:DNA mismatch repair protein MSH4